MRTPKLLTVREAAKIVRVHPLSLYRLIREGKVPVVRFGRNIRVIEEELYRGHRHTEETAHLQGVGS